MSQEIGSVDLSAKMEQPAQGEQRRGKYQDQHAPMVPFTPVPKPLVKSYGDWYGKKSFDDNWTPRRSLLAPNCSYPKLFGIDLTPFYLFY